MLRHVGGRSGIHGYVIDTNIHQCISYVQSTPHFFCYAVISTHIEPDLRHNGPCNFPKNLERGQKLPKSALKVI